MAACGELKHLVFYSSTANNGFVKPSSLIWINTFNKYYRIFLFIKKDNVDLRNPSLHTFGKYKTSFYFLQVSIAKGNYYFFSTKYELNSITIYIIQNVKSGKLSRIMYIIRFSKITILQLQFNTCIMTYMCLQ